MSYSSISGIPKRVSTKQHIANVTESLLESLPVKAVTVKMISDAAEVSKTTFYRYFKDVNDIILWIYTSGVDEAAQRCTSFEDLVLAAYRFMAQRPKYMQRALSYNQQNNLADYICERSKYDIMNYAKVALDGTELSCSLMKSIDFFCAGCRAAWTAWIAHDMDESPEDVVRSIMENIPEPLKPILLCAEGN